MNTTILQKWPVILSSLLAAVILLVAILWGYAAGRSETQSSIIEQSASSLVKAINYFYSDQSRFPTALEFSDQNVMLNYLNTFPAPSFTSAACPESYDYELTSGGYSLAFCLPSGFGGYQKGWNIINGTPPPAQVSGAGNSP